MYDYGQGTSIMTTGGSFNDSLQRFQTQQLANVSALQTPPGQLSPTENAARASSTPATLPTGR